MVPDAVRKSIPMPAPTSVRVLSLVVQVITPAHVFATSIRRAHRVLLRHRRGLARVERGDEARPAVVDGSTVTTPNSTTGTVSAMPIRRRLSRPLAA